MLNISVLILNLNKLVFYDSLFLNADSGARGACVRSGFAALRFGLRPTDKKILDTASSVRLKEAVSGGVLCVYSFPLGSPFGEPLQVIRIINVFLCTKGFIHEKTTLYYIFPQTSSPSSDRVKSSIASLIFSCLIGPGSAMSRS